MEAVGGEGRVTAHTTSAISPTKTSGTTKKSRANAEWNIIISIWSGYPWAAPHEARGDDRLLGFRHDGRRRTRDRPGRGAARLRLAVDRRGIRFGRRNSPRLAGGRYLAHQARCRHLPDPSAERRHDRDDRSHDRQPLQRPSHPWHAHPGAAAPGGAPPPALRQAAAAH